MKTTFTVTLDEIKKGMIRELISRGCPEGTLKEEDVFITPLINDGVFNGLEVEIDIEVA